jgi:hypothetical protein
MRPLPDRLNDRLERQRHGERIAASSKDQDQEVDELAMLARRLQVTPQLRVDPGFAQRLEARILAHHAVQSRRQAPMTRGNVLFQSAPWKLGFGIALICLLVVGTMGTLSVAAQVTNPHNPLYGIKLLEQHFQYPQMDATMTQAETNRNNAQTQMDKLANLTGSTHSADYRKGLADLERQIDQMTRSIQTLPPGPDRDNLANKLMKLKADARQMLRSLLPHLALSEQIMTTDELRRLGDTVPNIDSIVMVVAHPQKQATITIMGNNLQPGARLVMDNHLMTTSGTWQNGTVVFIVSWPGKDSPKTIGILNPDSTATQTSTFTFTLTEGNNNGNGKDNGNNNGNNGNNNGNNGNNNDNGNNGNNNGNNGNNNDNGNNNNNGNNGNNNDNGNGKGKGKGVATPTPVVLPTPTMIP